MNQRNKVLAEGKVLDFASLIEELASSL